MKLTKLIKFIKLIAIIFISFSLLLSFIDSNTNTENNTETSTNTTTTTTNETKKFNNNTIINNPIITEDDPFIRTFKLDNQTELTKTLNKTTYSFIYYTIPGCYQCEIFEKELSKTIRELYRKAEDPFFPIEENLSDLSFTKLDFNDNHRLYEELKIKEFPLIEVYINGTSKYQYKGPKEQHEMEIFLYKFTSASRSHIVFLESVEAVEKFRSKTNVTAVLASLSDEPNDVFIKQAVDNPNVFFGICSRATKNPQKWSDKKKEEVVDLDLDSDSDSSDQSESIGSLCITHYNTKSSSSVILHRQFVDEESRVDFDNLYPSNSPLAEKNMKESYTKFIERYSFPIVNPASEKTINRILTISRPSLVIFNVNSTHPEYNNAVETINEARDKLKDDVFILTTTYGEILDQTIRNFFGITEKKLPFVKLIQLKGDKPEKYSWPIDTPINKGNLIKFVNDFKYEQLRPEGKSQPIPDTQPDRIYNLVFYTFEELVFDEEKDVLVEFYSEECSFCKQFVPTYHELARLFENNKKLLIAKYNLPENPLQIKIEALPGIVLWRAGKKNQPIMFDGDKNLIDLARFLMNHATNKLEVKELFQDDGDEDEDL